MCGIVGKIDFTGAPVGEPIVAAMMRRVAHRGPDAHANWIGRDAGVSVGLGHRRLSVIDLSAAAAQPMVNTGCHEAGHASKLVIVFNGEIYNYPELRTSLEQAGHQLRTHSDTEAILHLYEDLGPGCVSRLRGMFAFAIWDAANRRVFCARDRVGKKPFYYRFDQGRFWFASEGPAILVDPDVPADVDDEAVLRYLNLGYVPGDRSAFRALSRIPPAHTLTVTQDGAHLERYWELSYQPKTDIGDREAEERLAWHLRESVRMRLLSDVPLGVFLSGGIDSSLITMLTCAEAPDQVSTFSIGFEDAQFDERPEARRLAAQFGTNHHELVVKPDVLGLVPRLAWHYGEPYADSSAIPTYYLARLAKPHITVALNGDGGDESFAGYKRYRGNQLADSLQRLPRVIRRGVGVAAGWLPGGQSSRSRLSDVRRFFDAAALPAATRYARWFGFMGGDLSLLDPAFAERVAGTDPIEPLSSLFGASSSLNPAEQCMNADVHSYLPDDLLVKVDIAAMANGLEARSPLLDHVVMEFAASLPIHLKLRGNTSKYLLKRLLKGTVPPGTLSRRKTGFGVPLEHWLRHELRDFVRDLLLSDRARQRHIVNHDAVCRMVDEHQAGQKRHHSRLWSLMMLELWFRLFVDRAHDRTAFAEFTGA